MRGLRLSQRKRERWADRIRGGRKRKGEEKTKQKERGMKTEFPLPLAVLRAITQPPLLSTARKTFCIRYVIVNHSLFLYTSCFTSQPKAHKGADKRHHTWFSGSKSKEGRSESLHGLPLKMLMVKINQRSTPTLLSLHAAWFYRSTLYYRRAAGAEDSP